MKIIGKYKNGNYDVSILSDGTKIRETKDDDFIPAFSENCDIKITDKCSGAMCSFCHEGSSPNGKHGDLLNVKFIDTLHPYTEIAIGGGNALDHPDLIPFLKKLKEKKVIANITVNQIHFIQKQDLVRQLVGEKLVYGIGVSLVDPSNEFIKIIKQYDNAVIHTINGVLTADQIEKLSNHDLKILILGYKMLRRGVEHYNKESEKIKYNQHILYEKLSEMPELFKVVSFDNLAIEQLEVKRLMSDNDWNEFYMGDDATSTFYIDMVEKKFAKNSIAPMDERYDLLDNIDDMFHKIRASKKEENI